jgi:transposase
VHFLASRSAKIPKQEYTTEFKEQAVKYVKAGKSICAVAKELGKAAKTGKLTWAGSKVVTQEQMKLSRLRAENVRLKRECKK